MEQGGGTDMAEFRQSVRAFAEEHLPPYIDEAERAGRVPADVIGLLAANGYLGLALPMEYGGGGLGLAYYATMQEELARVWASAAVATTWTHLSGRLLAAFGSERLKERWLSRVARGDSLGAVAFTEPSGGSDPANLQAVAERSDDGWVLSGRKWLIDNAEGADFFIVAARSDPQASPPHRGVTMFLVERENPGLRFGGLFDILTLRAAGVGWFDLERASVPVTAVVGEAGRGFYQMMSMFEFGRVNVAGMCTGIAQAGLEGAKDFVAHRTVAGRPLSESDVIRTRIAEMATMTNASRVFTQEVAARFDRGEASDQASAMAKLLATQTAVDVTSSAMQLHGGIGLTSRSPVERHFRDARMGTVGEGTTEVLKILVGRRELGQ